MKTNLKMNNLKMALIFSVAIFFILAIVASPEGIAFADTFNTEVDWRALYEDYIGDSNKDWYFDKEYLDLYGAMEAVHDMVNDPKFNKDALKADPIVIASIDNGIGAGYAYNDAYGTEVRVGFTHVVVDQNDAVFKVHPIFDGVILTDENGDYVYGNVAQEIQFTDKNGNMSLIVFANNGDIGHDLVSFDKHGVSTAGLIAFFIHMFGLEDYIKIMPINADDVYYFDSNGVFRQAYTFDAMDRAVIFAREHGADIINASFGGGRPTICDELASEILVVAAAGNDNKYYLQYPAGSDNVVGVVNYSRDADGEIELYTHSSDGSNYGEWYDIAAPGQNAVASAYGSYLSSPYTYSVMGGTSMASPFVAFAGALAMFRFRGYDNYGVGIELTPQVYKEMIVSGTDKTVTKVADEGTFIYPVLDFNGIVTTDFYNDIDFLKSIGVSLECILDITSDTKSFHNFGDTIKLTANINAGGLLDKIQPYWWYNLNGESYEIGYGREIDFQIPDQEGKYEINCVILDENGEICSISKNSLTFSAYPRPESVAISSDAKAEYKEDATEKVTLSAIVYPANAFTTDTLVWLLIAGEEITEIGTGMTLVYDIPNTVGEYEITCAFKNADGYHTYSTNSVEFAVTYYELESVSIVGDVESEYKIDTTDSITLNAVINPANAHMEDTLVWLLTTDENTTEIGMGMTLVYNIPNAVGEYEITCAFKNADGYHTYSTNSIEFAVTYYELESVSIVGEAENEYKIDTTDSITLNAVITPTNAHVEDALVWLLSTGVLTVEIGTGMTLNYDIPNSAGEYKIRCALKGDKGYYSYSTNSVEFAVTYYELESVSIVGEAENEYKIDNAANITLNAVINPTNAHVEDTLVWLLSTAEETIEIGEGFTLNYNIPNAVGEYEITCVFKNADGYHTYSTNSVEFAVTYYELENVSIVGDIESEYKVDTIDSITLSAVLNPTNAHVEDTLVWLLTTDENTTEIGTGMTLNYNIPNTVGEYEITCVFKNADGYHTYSTNSIEFAVTYYQLESVSIVGDVESEYKIDNTANITLNAVINPANAHVEDTLVWLLTTDENTTEIGTGMTLNYDIPNSAGEYEITCAFKNVDGYHTYSTNSIEFAVTYYELESVSIVGEAENEYKIDTTDSIALGAVLNPTNAHVEDTLVWLLSTGVLTVEIGTGMTLVYNIPNAVGEYEITCAFKNADGYHTYSTNSVEFAVTYYELENVSIIGDIESEYKVDTIDSITLSAVLNPTNAHVEDTLVWLLTTDENTTEIGTGMTLNYNIPNTVGEYEITCVFKNADGYHTYSTNSIEFAVTYYELESVSIVGDVESEYKIDNTANITLNAVINPTNAHVEDTLVWLLSSNMLTINIGTGMTLNYDIPNSVGEYKIRCAFKNASGYYCYSTNSYEFSVKNYRIEEIEIKPNIADVDDGKMVTITLPSDLLGSDVVAGAKWYLNGKSVAGGFQFKMQISTAGEYTIRLYVNGHFVDVCSFTVEGKNETPEPPQDDDNNEQVPPQDDDNNEQAPPQDNENIDDSENVNSREVALTIAVIVLSVVLGTVAIAFVTLLLVKRSRKDEIKR